MGLDDKSLDGLRSHDPLYLNEAGDVVYESCEGDGYSVLDGVRRPLHGTLLIVGTTEDGEDCDPKVRLKELKESIDFGTASNGMYFGDTIVRALQ